jgi:hypothetical protein
MLVVIVRFALSLRSGDKTGKIWNSSSVPVLPLNHCDEQFSSKNQNTTCQVAGPSNHACDIYSVLFLFVF